MQRAADACEWTHGRVIGDQLLRDFPFDSFSWFHVARYIHVFAVHDETSPLRSSLVHPRLSMHGFRRLGSAEQSYHKCLHLIKHDMERLGDTSDSLIVDVRFYGTFGRSRMEEIPLRVDDFPPTPLFLLQAYRDALLYRAECLLWLGEHEEAAVALTTLFRTFPADPYACYFMSMCLFAQSRRKAASVWAKKAARFGLSFAQPGEVAANEHFSINMKHWRACRRALGLGDGAANAANAQHQVQGDEEVDLEDDDDEEEDEDEDDDEEEEEGDEEVRVVRVVSRAGARGAGAAAAAAKEKKTAAAKAKAEAEPRAVNNAAVATGATQQSQMVVDAAATSHTADVSAQSSSASSATSRKKRSSNRAEEASSSSKRARQDVVVEPAPESAVAAEPAFAAAPESAPESALEPASEPSPAPAHMVELDDESARQHEHAPAEHAAPVEPAAPRDMSDDTPLSPATTGSIPHHIVTNGDDDGGAGELVDLTMTAGFDAGVSANGSTSPKSSSMGLNYDRAEEADDAHDHDDSALDSSAIIIDVVAAGDEENREQHDEHEHEQSEHELNEQRDLQEQSAQEQHEHEQHELPEQNEQNDNEPSSGEEISAPRAFHQMLERRRAQLLVELNELNFMIAEVARFL